jgi:[acyl-carrier-protein] S-malonyltransferase
MLVIAAPGQGAQTPGFLAPWLELPGVAERLGAWSELAGCDLIRCGTVASADDIRDTAVAQPLIVAAALAVSELLTPGALAGALPAARTPDGAALASGAVAGQAVGGQAVGGQAAGDLAHDGHAAPGGHVGGLVAGHSVGELAAGAIAGVLDPADAIRLVRVRGQAMARAAAAVATSMTAILGGDEAEVLACIDAHGLTPANINGAGQIVAAGTVEQLAAFAADPPPRARLRSLRVAGAFHTTHMASAVDALRDAASGMTVRDPSLTLLSNRDGAVVRSGADWLERVVNQVSAPVRWDKCMQAMAALGATALIELPPAGTLTGLAHRALRGIGLLAVKTPDHLDAARAMIADHADSHELQVRPALKPQVGAAPKEGS